MARKYGLAMSGFREFLDAHLNNPKLNDHYSGFA